MEIPTKDKLIQDLSNSFQETIDWINEQPESRFNEKIIAEKWSIAAHLYHLIKSTKSVSKGIAMPRLGLRTMFGKNNRIERTYNEMVEKYHEVVVQNSFKTLKIYEAEENRTFERAALIKRFQDEQKDFITALEKWKEKDLAVYVMPHPALGKLTIREFVYFTILHTYHHLENLKRNYVK